MRTLFALPSLLTRLISLAAVAGLAACGSGEASDPVVVPPQPVRGTIVSSANVATLSKAQLTQALTASGLIGLTGAPLCDVSVQFIVYETRGPRGESARAATALYTPVTNTAVPACTGSRPTVLYAHGTATGKNKNMADPNDGEASLNIGFFASQGMVVVAPNYLGYTGSTLNYHPYLNAEASAIDMVDGYRAAIRTFQNPLALPAPGSVLPANRVFVTGYSQGGHVAMATARAIERDYASEINLVASAPLAGPHNLKKFGDVVFGPGPINAGATIFLPMLITSYQFSYGNLYARTSDVYRAPYDTTAENLFPSTQSVTDLLLANRIPQDPTFTRLFGTGGLFTDAFRNDYLTNPNNGFARTGAQNSLIDWTPRKAMALCAGGQDPVVFAFNSVDAKAAFATRGFNALYYDVEQRSTLPAGALGDQLFGGFQAAKIAAGIEIQTKYHGELVPPFCMALARGFFAAQP